MDSMSVLKPGCASLSSEPVQGLVWLPEIGIGFVPPSAGDADIYDASYFAEYVNRSQSAMGHRLTAARIELVADHHLGEVLDVGIGSGQFVATRPDTYGFDINPAGVAWLNERELYRDLYATTHEALAFWDSLEHMECPADAVAQARRWAFVSLPIFENSDHCLASKHFKPGEHIWYFEDRGIRAWFDKQGFDCVASDQRESDLGREGIGSYVFKRREVDHG